MKIQNAYCWVFVASFTVTHAATVINFDDLSPNPDWVVVGSGYQGLQWNNFGTLDGSNRAGLDGYGNGTVSPRNVAFNIAGNPASFSCPNRFDLNSAYITAQVAGLSIHVQGLLGANEIYNNTYTVSPNAPTLINFNYVGIDHVNFFPVGNYIFVLDNLTITITNSPIPATNFQNVQVETIGHFFQNISPRRTVRDYIIDQTQTSGGGGLLQPAQVNFNTNSRYTLRIAAPPGKRFLIHSPEGKAVSFFGSILWDIGGSPGPGDGFGVIEATYGGLQGTPPDFSASRSILSDFNGTFGFYSIASTGFTNDLSFNSITLTAEFSPSYTNSGTLSYPVGSFAAFGLVAYTSQTNDPGRVIQLVNQPTLSLRMSPNGDVTLTFTGALQSANSASGPYQDVPGNPQGTFVIPKANLLAQQYFRTRGK